VAIDAKINCILIIKKPLPYEKGRDFTIGHVIFFHFTFV
jgi:hypothetical protein